MQELLPCFIRERAFCQVRVFLQHPLPPEFAGKNRITFLKRLEKNLVNEEQLRSEMQSLSHILGNVESIENENEATQQNMELDQEQMQNHRGYLMNGTVEKLNGTVEKLNGTMEKVFETVDNLKETTDNLKKMTDNLQERMDRAIHDEREARIYQGNQTLKRLRRIENYLPASSTQFFSPLHDGYMCNE